MFLEWKRRKIFRKKIFRFFFVYQQLPVWMCFFPDKNLNTGSCCKSEETNKKNANHIYRQEWPSFFFALCDDYICRVNRLSMCACVCLRACIEQEISTYDISFHKKHLYFFYLIQLCLYGSHWYFVFFCIL